MPKLILPSLCTLLVLIGVAGLNASLLDYSSGPPNDRACAPPSYSNCSQCHASFVLNSGPGMVEILDVPAVYSPGANYTLRVSLTDPAASRWGFELTAMDTSSNGAGVLTPLDAETQVHSSPSADFIKHTSVGTAAGTTGGHVWRFRWTAPAANTGIVRFFATGNAADHSFSTTGDYIYSTASSSAASVAADASIVLQPDDNRPNLGTNWTVRARIRNHTASSNSMVVVSRVRLANGSYFPSSGWLLPPANVTIVPAGQESVDLVHLVPASAPLITATYEAFAGRVPSTLVASDSFTFTTTP